VAGACWPARPGQARLRNQAVYPRLNPGRLKLRQARPQARPGREKVACRRLCSVQQKKVPWEITKPWGFCTKPLTFGRKTEWFCNDTNGFVQNPQGFVFSHGTFFCCTEPNKRLCKRWFCEWVKRRTFKRFCRIFESCHKCPLENVLDKMSPLLVLRKNVL
jgi:hypothetical protein